jgi:hypothetical protein
VTQILTIDKSLLIEKVGAIADKKMSLVEKGLRQVLYL